MARGDGNQVVDGHGRSIPILVIMIVYGISLVIHNVRGSYIWFCILRDSVIHM